MGKVAEDDRHGNVVFGDVPEQIKQSKGVEKGHERSQHEHKPKKECSQQVKIKNQRECASMVIARTRAFDLQGRTRGDGAVGRLCRIGQGRFSARETPAKRFRPAFFGTSMLNSSQENESNGKGHDIGSPHSESRTEHTVLRKMNSRDEKCVVA